MNPRDTEFQKDKKLGSGSFGTVWLVQQRSDGQRFALKEIDLGKPGMHQAMKEVQTMTSLPPHRNVVRLHEHWTSDDGKDMWLLLEYCSQGTLAQFLGASARLPDAALWDLAGQLLQALLLFEQHRIVHNDIKPENIFIMEGGIPKIGDLGMARFTSVGSVLSKTPGGTPVFQAPEVLSKEKGADGRPLCFPKYASCDVSYQSDVYSVGVVLWSMIMRRNPDHPGGAFPLTSAHVSDSRLRDLINNMLQPDPTKRRCASHYVDLFGCDDARVIKIGYLKKQAFLNIMRERSFALKSGRNPRLFYSAACAWGQTLDTPASFDRCITLSASSTAAVEPGNQTDFILSNVKCVKASSLRGTT